ncbi:MAG: rod shape-determining protein RodA [Candidatus Eisenbacteria bacterium]
MNLRVYRKHNDWLLMLPTLLLVLAGVATIYSATRLATGDASGFFERHLMYLAMGSVVFGFFFFLPLRLWEDWSYVVYGISLLLLVAVLLFGVDSHGAQRWFQVGPLRSQPSEFAKLALVAVLARYLGGKRVDLSRPGPLAIAMLLVLAPTALVLQQPDLGTAGAFPALALPMLIWAGMPRILLFILLSPIIGLLLVYNLVFWVLFLVFSIVVFRRSRLSNLLLGLFLLLQVGLHVGAPRVIETLHPYQQARIHTFFHPESDPSGSGWQVLQSRIAIGSGQLFGTGYLQGSQKKLAFLPMQHNDFIFSVIGEEWGFFGAAVIVILFGLLVARSVRVATQCRSPFGSLLLVGVAGLIFYHAAVNMAMTMGLFPVTGLPLPFLSYGGSFLWTMLAAAGQMGNVAAHRFEY